MTNFDRVALHQFLTHHYTIDGLKTLCYYFGVDYEQLDGRTKDALARELILYMERVGHVELLLSLMNPDVQAAQSIQLADIPHRRASPLADTYKRRKIFISHAREDSAFAHRLATDLEHSGYAIWIAPESILPGEQWVKAINRGLDESNVMILVLTPAAVTSRWVEMETNIAIEMEREGVIRFIPILHTHGHYPALWRSYQWVMGTDYTNKLASLRAQLSSVSPASSRPSKAANYVAVVDQNTTFTRCMLFNHNGLPVGIHQLEHKQIYPQVGWVEHDPMEIWKQTQDVIESALKAAQVTAKDIAAVGVTNQSETTVAWDKKTGKPYYNAIVWQDTRTAKLLKEFEGKFGQNRFRDKVGLPLATYFSGPKVRWLLDNVKGMRDAANRGDAAFGTIDTWVIWWLTGGPNGGVHVTDVTNASRTMLMNLRTLDWDQEVLGIMGVPLSMMPEVMPSSAVYGYTREDGPFGGRIPVAGDLVDQRAAMVGQVAFSPGEAKNTYGTGCFITMNTGTKIVQSKNGLLTTLCYKFGEKPAVYALEGSLPITGALAHWLRDNLGFFENLPDFETLARTVDDNGGVYFVPAFSGLFAPYWRSDARGVIVGLTRYVNKGHIARAALEATAYQTREVLDAMNADSGVPLTALKVDGGMVYNDTLMQFQADVLGVPVIRPQVAETTALGAAYAAGLAVGFWETEDDIRQNWAIDKTWEPNKESKASTENYRMWKKAITRTLDWVE